MFLQQILNGLVTGSTYALVALGLVLIFGVLGIPNFAHGTLFMLGAFLGFVLVTNLHLNYFLGMILSMACLALVGMAVEWFPFRQMRKAPILNLMIASLGVYIIVEEVALLIWGEQPRLIPFPFKGVNLETRGLSISLHRVLVVLITLLTILLTHLFVKKTRIGKAMRAVACDKEAAETMGININLISTATVSIGTALAALAGVLIGSLFYVNTTMGAMPIIKAFVIIIIGGVGNILGAILGGFLLGIAESIGSGYLSADYKDSFAFAILIVYLLFNPYVAKLRHKWIRTKA